MIAAAKRAARPVIVDPKAADYAVYRGATVITPNRRELATRRAASRVGDAASLRRRRACRIVDSEAVLVTRSEEGMSLYAQGRAPVRVPAYAVKVRDASGAGDTVVAALAVMLARGADFEIAMRAANARRRDRGRQARHRDGVRRRVAPSGAAAAATALEDKMVFDRAVLDERLADWRRQRLRIGFTNGCFDLLHRGHVRLMAEARSACDRLVVGLNSDASVKRLKGPGRPIQDVASRADVLAALEAVDLVVVFEEDTPLELIRQVRPAVLVKGGDYARQGCRRPRDRRGRRRRSDPRRSGAGPQHDQHGGAVGRAARPDGFPRRGTGVPRLSAIIITKDEAANIGDCLDSRSRSATSASWSMPAAATARC